MSIVTESTSIPPVVAPAQAVTPPVEKNDEPVADLESAETTEDEGASETESQEEENAEGEDESESDEAKAVTKKPLKGFKKRIDKLSRQRADAEREAEYWKSLVLKGKEEPAVKHDPKPEALEGKPIADSYATHAEFVEALADWKVEQRLKAGKEEDAKKALLTQARQKVDSYVKKSEDFEKTHEDFHEVLESVDDIPFSHELKELLLDSDNGPELTYELAKARAEYERISKLSGTALAREFGKFEAKINLSKDSEKKPQIKTTKAPAPISPVGGNSTSLTKKSIYDPGLSQAEYEALRNKQRAK
jgi:hypothetical protein